MKKLLPLICCSLLFFANTSVFAQTATITQVPGGTVKQNTAASDGVTPADYIFTVTNISVPDPANPPTIFIEGKIAGALVANRLPKVDPADTANVTDNGDGTYNAQFTYSKLNNFGTINFDDVIDITMGVSGISATAAQVTVEAAPAELIDIDSIEVVPTVERGSEFTVNFNYSSNVDITSLRINFWVVTFGPYADLFVGNSALITDLVSTGGVSTAASATVTFPAATEVMNGGGTTWTLNSPITADNGATNVLYQYRFRLDDATGPTGQNFASGGGQKAFNFVDIQAVTNDADMDGVNTFAVDGSILDVCPTTPAGEVGTIDTDMTSPTYGCSTNEQIALSVEDFSRASIGGYFGPNPVNDIIEISDQVKTETYKIISLSGTTIKEVRAEGSINVSDLASGFYFLVTDVGNGKFIKR